MLPLGVTIFQYTKENLNILTYVSKLSYISLCVLLNKLSNTLLFMYSYTFIFFVNFFIFQSTCSTSQSILVSVFTILLFLFLHPISYYRKGNFPYFLFHSFPLFLSPFSFHSSLTYLLFYLLSILSSFSLPFLTLFLVLPISSSPSLCPPLSLAFLLSLSFFLFFPRSFI